MRKSPLASKLKSKAAHNTGVLNHGQVVQKTHVSSRRTHLVALAAAASSLLWHRDAECFGQSGAFRVRRLRFGTQLPDAARDTAASRWAWELMQRTSAPARLDGCTVPAQSAQLLDEPFAIWSGFDDPGPLSAAERRAVDRFLRMGGLLIVDDSSPSAGNFGRGTRREISSIVSDSPIQVLAPQHVLYKSFYLLNRPAGRYAGSGKVDAISRGRLAQVLFLDCDLLGALSTLSAGHWTFDIASGGPRQREEAIRFATNIAMYLLCSDYKDDQVHAAWLMRHRLQNRK